MPLHQNQVNIFVEPSVGDELKKSTKRAIYVGAIATAATVFLGGETFSESSSLLGMTIPAPIVAGVGMGVGSVAGVLLQDMVLEKVFKDSSDSIRGVERTAVQAGLAITGGLVGLKYISGIAPSLNAGLLAGGSYAVGSYVHNELDASLLGMLF